MRIAAYDIPKEITDEIELKHPEIVLRRTDRDLDINNVDKEAEMFIVRYSYSTKIDGSILSRAKKLKYILTASTGTDHIDYAYCKDRGIQILNCKEYATNAVAEFAILLALFGLRNAYSASLSGKQLDYSNNYKYIGHEISGKTCGVLGTGRIGANIAKKLISLGCRVLAYDIFENEDLKSNGVKYEGLEDVLKKSDLIFLSLPLTEKTHHILNKYTFQYVRDGVGIINVGRGELIDNKALYTNIERIGFAALDVVEGESGVFIGNPPEIVKELSKKPNVFTFPHIGARTFEAEENKKEEVVRIVESLL